jgi:hypothetical protein
MYDNQDGTVLILNSVCVARDMSGPLMTEAQFETMRLYLILGTLVYRLFLMPKYLQVSPPFSNL